MNNDNIQVLLYLGDEQVGDINKITKNRHLQEGLKSEATNATADQFTFNINWRQFKNLVAKKFDDDPETFLRVGKTRVIMVVNGLPRFAGWLASRPARNGLGSAQTLSLTFYEPFARLSGDLVSDPNNKNLPTRRFDNRPGHLYVQDLINEFLKRAKDAGETLNWSWGVINQLANKSITYNDFQTVGKALCDAMNNTTGTGKFDVHIRVDPEDYTHYFIDVLKPRGRNKNIIIQYPGDGVYKLWSSGYEVEETNDYASEVLVAGNGQVGDAEAGEDTAEIASEANNDFVEEYGYFRVYDPQSNLETLDAVSAHAKKSLAQKAFNLEAPNISLEGRPITWGYADNDNNGLALGDTFYFMETNDDGSDMSGYFRIIGLDTSWDDNGVATVKPALMRDN